MSHSLNTHVEKGQFEAGFMRGLSKFRTDHIKFDRIPLDIFVGADPEELRKKQRVLVSMDLRVSP